MRLPVVLPLALCLLGLAAPAVAEEDPCGPSVRDPGRLAEAGLRIYQDAVRKLEPRDPQAAVRQYEVALRCFRGVTQLSHEPAKIFHPMGLVYQRLGRYTEAFSAFKRFLAEVPEDKRKPGVTKQVQDKLAELKQYVAELTIDTVPDLPVRVDDADVGRSPLPRTVPVTPGAHTVTVGDPERGTLGADVTVRAGEVRRVDLTAWQPRTAVAQVPVQAPLSPSVQQVAATPAAGRAVLTIRANRGPARVRLDGTTLGDTPLEGLPVAPGDHRLVANIGATEIQQALHLDRGETRTVELSFPSRTRPLAIALGVVGGVLIVSAAVGLGVYYGTSSGPDRVLHF